MLLGFYLYRAYRVDPLYLFHLPSELSEKVESISTDVAIPMFANMRIQAAGIINNYNFDSILLGTSILQNASSKQCNELLGGIFVNISISGGSFYEREIILDYALRKKKLKNIIYSMDSNYIYCNKGNKFYEIENWKPLYTENISKITMYMTKRYFSYILYNEKKDHTVTPDRPQQWMTNKSHMCRFGGIENWIANQDEPGVGNFLRHKLPLAAQLAKKNRQTACMRDMKTEELAKEYVEKNILRFAAEYPDTKFYLFFPPYWRYVFAEYRQIHPQYYAAHQEVIRYTVSRADALGNVFVFGFEDCAFVDNIENYKDTTHFSPELNEYITESMGKRKHLLTPDNIDEYLRRCEKLASDFDFQSLADDVKKRLAVYDAPKKQ